MDNVYIVDILTQPASWPAVHLYMATAMHFCQWQAATL
jgi:hypothetical protein